MAVTDEAILRIKEMILAGELAPGDRLPPEKELSERLGLSRNCCIAVRTCAMRGFGPPMQQSPGPPCSAGQLIEHERSNIT